MKISETTYTVNQHGNLMIPKRTLSEMGLGPGNHVRVAYLSTDGTENTYREFLLSADPLDKQEESKRIAVPTELLLQANIRPDADIQVICTDGAIILSQDPVLQTEDLRRVLSSLEIAADLLEQLPDDHVEAMDTLQQFIETNKEGAYDYDDGNS